MELTAGTQRWDFIYIEDVLNVYELVIDHSFEKAYTEIEVGTGEAPTIREVVEYLKTIIGSKSELRFGSVPMRNGESNSSCDPGKMRQLRGGKRLVLESRIEICGREIYRQDRTNTLTIHNI